MQFLLERWAWLENPAPSVLQTLIHAVAQCCPQSWRILNQIPGIGPRIATLFLALVVDLDRFPSTKTITTFGLDVALYQSDRFAVRRRLSKYGGPLHRYVALYLIP